MLTVPVFAAVCPRCPPGRLTAIVAALRTAFDQSTIDTPARLAAFLAQAAHESGEFRWWQELWGPTEAQRRYEPPHDKAVELGNAQTGDGFRYRGRGPFQLTGRRNYRQCGERLGYPLEADPDLVSEVPVGCLSAVDYWDTRGLSALADAETVASFRLITRRLNGGANGLPQREAYHAAARQVLGLAPLTEARGAD
jgi:putative chitinase